MAEVAAAAAVATAEAVVEGVSKVVSKVGAHNTQEWQTGHSHLDSWGLDPAAAQDSNARSHLNMYISCSPRVGLEVEAKKGAGVEMVGVTEAVATVAEEVANQVTAELKAAKGGRPRRTCTR